MNFHTRTIFREFNNLSGFRSFFYNKYPNFIFKMLILKYFYFLDLFRRPVYLLFNSQEKVASRLGLLCSLLIYVLIIYDFSKNDIFYKESPKIISQPMTQAQRPFVNFHDKLFTISLVDDNSLPYVDPSIFTISAKNVFMKSDANGGFYMDSVQEHGLHLCEESDFEKDSQVFEELGLKNSYCLDRNSFVVEGYWDEPTVSYFSLELSLCNNKTSAVVCKRNEEINEFFSMKYFNLVYSDLRVDSQNYLVPITTKYRNDFQLVDPKMKKMLNIFIKSVTLITDAGLLFSEEKTQRGLAYDSSFTDFSMIRTTNSSDSIRFVCDFYSAKESDKIRRTYQKFSEVFAIVGGLLSFLMILGFLLTYFEKKYYMTKKVMNSLYSFQQETKEKPAGFELKSYPTLLQSPDTKEKNLGSSINESLKKNALSMNKIPDHIGLMSEIPTEKEVKDEKYEKDVKNEKNENSKNATENSQEKSKFAPFSKENYGNKPKIKEKTTKINFFKKFQNEKNKIALNFLDFIYSKIMNLCTCCQKSFKQKLFLKAQQIYENEMDITYILRKLQEIEKLKLVLLNPKQLSLFNLLAKPMIYVEKDRVMKNSGGGYVISDLLSSTLNEKSLKKAIEYYEIQQKFENMSEIDGRLFRLVDENINEFKTYFEFNE